MIKIGAFDYGSYTKGMNGGKDPRLAAAIKAIKRELVYNGFDKNIDVTTPVFGDAAYQRLKEFQLSKGIVTGLGKAGQTTLTELFRKRVEATEAKYDLPEGALGKKLKLESGYDPVAIGFVDKNDLGIAQINVGIHQSVSKDEAFDPAFAIDWAGRYIRSNHDLIARQMGVMTAARAAYNIGNGNAIKWMQAGFPESGGPLLGGQDVFERATKYIALIDRQVW